MISGAVIFAKAGNTLSPDSLNSGCVGEGTRKAKSSAIPAKVAWRMKCSICVAGSQRIRIVWSAFNTGLPGGCAQAQARAGWGSRTSKARLTINGNIVQVRRRMDDSFVNAQGRCANDGFFFSHSDC